MEHPMNSVISALGFGPREHVAIVGGGGKTSLLFAVADALVGAGRKVVMGTTTKVWQTEARGAPGIVLLDSERNALPAIQRGLERNGCVFVGRGMLENGKVAGVTPEFADELFLSSLADCLILEADGAAGRSVKAPSEKEPVIPCSATMVVAVAGLDALGKPLGPETVFRMEHFQEITGLKVGDRLRPEHLGMVFESAYGLFKGSPKNAARIGFLNKVDLARGKPEVRLLVRRLLQVPGRTVDRVVLASVCKNRYCVIHGDHD